MGRITRMLAEIDSETTNIGCSEYNAMGYQILTESYVTNCYGLNCFESHCPEAEPRLSSRLIESGDRKHIKSCILLH